MNRKAFALVLIAVLVGVSMSACTRSATSKNPAATSTSEIPFPVGTLDTSTRMTEIIAQTKAAQATEPAATSSQSGGETTSGQPSATSAVVATQAPTAIPQPTATLPPIPTLERPATYTLQPGEWPICIARRYNLDIGGLLAANSLSMDSQPQAGTVLTIPGSGAWSSGDRQLKDHPTTYDVQSGDTIYTIACAFGDVSPEGIIAANNLQSPYTLSTGQSLRIP